MSTRERSSSRRLPSSAAAASIASWRSGPSSVGAISPSGQHLDGARLLEPRDRGGQPGLAQLRRLLERRRLDRAARAAPPRRPSRARPGRPARRRRRSGAARGPRAGRRAAPRPARRRGRRGRPPGSRSRATRRSRRGRPSARSALSTPMPNAVVATTTSSSSAMNRSWTSSRSPAAHPGVVGGRAQPVARTASPASSLGRAPRRDVDDARRRRGGDVLAQRAALAVGVLEAADGEPDVRPVEAPDERPRGRADPAARRSPSRTGGAAVAVSASTGGRPSASAAAPSRR